jgi:hypothetical protein
MLESQTRPDSYLQYEYLNSGDCRQSSVADPPPDPACNFDEGPYSDPACYFDLDPDPDPTFHFSEDPNPDLRFQIKGSKP